MNAGSFQPQPSDVPWPTKTWPRGELDPVIKRSNVDGALDVLFASGTDSESDRGVSLALLVVAGGRLVIEKYGTSPAGAFAPETPIDAETSLISWSMAKSMTQTLTGLMVDDALISIDDRVDFIEWSHDERATITIRHLLQMRDGLDFIEDYVVDADGNSQSDVIEMLFGEGSGDVAAYAKSRPPKYEPGRVWSYSSGTTNILTSILGTAIGGPEAFATYMNERLFSAIGMTSAQPTFDAAGTFIGSSFVHATAQDFARFGYLYLRGGQWDGRRIVSAEWVDDASHQHVVDPETGHGYGSHWWIWDSRPGTLAALGYEGQRIIIDYERDIVVVHLGKWPAETRPLLDTALTRILESFPHSSGVGMLKIGND